MKSIINDQVEYDSTRKSLKHGDTTIILSPSTAQVGSLVIQGKHYAVDRNVVLKFIGKDHDGYRQTRRVAIVKNKNDNVPDEITELLMSRQDIFYYKVVRIAGNVYGIRDLRRTLMVCRAA